MERKEPRDGLCWRHSPFLQFFFPREKLQEREREWRKRISWKRGWKVLIAKTTTDTIFFSISPSSLLFFSSSILLFHFFLTFSSYPLSLSVFFSYSLSSFREANIFSMWPKSWRCRFHSKRIGIEGGVEPGENHRRNRFSLSLFLSTTSFALTPLWKYLLSPLFFSFSLVHGQRSFDSHFIPLLSSLVVHYQLWVQQNSQLSLLFSHLVVPLSIHDSFRHANTIPTPLTLSLSLS